MNKFFLFLIILCFPIKGKTIEFAEYAKQIKEEFRINKIRSNFAEELYKIVNNATLSFTERMDFKELKKRVSPIYLDYMATKIIEYNKDTFIALVWPVTVGNDVLIENIFNKYCNIICYKSIMLSHQGAVNFLSQIPSKASHPTGPDLWFQAPFRDYNPMRVYLIECKPNNTNHLEMKKYLVKIFSNNEDYIEEFEKKYGKKGIHNLYVTTKCKREIRNAVKLGYAMHVNDTNEETKLLGNIVFNENSISVLRYSDYTSVKKFNNFNSYIPVLKSVYSDFIDDIVVYNSSVLSVFGIRDCGDIDFLHNPRKQILANRHPALSNQNMYFKRHYVYLEDYSGKHYILEDAPNAFLDLDLDKTDKFRVKISIDDLLYNPRYYFHYHEVKFVTLEFMHNFKKKRGRAKDLRDVTLIEEHYLRRE